MSKMDLDKDVTINGVFYGKGKDVEVDSKHTEGVKEILDGQEGADAYANTHHGAVPPPKYPEEATAQTPTRPLAGPEMRQPATVKMEQNDGDLVVVDDKSQEKKVGSQEEAQKVNDNFVEKSKTFDEDESSSARPGNSVDAGNSVKPGNSVDAETVGNAKPSKSNK